MSIVNEIDGEMLLLLIEDLEEFCKVIPKAASRLKIKKLVKEWIATSDFEPSKVRYSAFVQ